MSAFVTQFDFQVKAQDTQPTLGLIRVFTWRSDSAAHYPGCLSQNSWKISSSAISARQMGNVLALKNCLSTSRPRVAPLFTLSFTKHSAYLHCGICHCAGGSRPWCNANCRYPRQTLTPTAPSSSCSYLLIRYTPPPPKKKPKHSALGPSLRLPPPVTCAAYRGAAIPAAGSQ